MPTDSHNRKFRVLPYVIELFVVFISVYAAFLLNAYQIRQQEDQRRAQLLAYLEKDADARARGAHALALDYDRDMNAFLHQLANGEMPSLQPRTWATNFTGTEGSALLQTGAFDVLSIETITQLLDVDSLERSGLALMAHHERLDDAMIIPYVGQERSYFYDTATGQLRPQFARYVKELKDGSRFLHRLSDARDQLATQVQAERRQFSSRRRFRFAR
jgi:hypothetical protein